MPKKAFVRPQSQTESQKTYATNLSQNVAERTAKRPVSASNSTPAELIALLTQKSSEITSQQPAGLLQRLSSLHSALNHKPKLYSNRT